MYKTKFSSILHLSSVPFLQEPKYYTMKFFLDHLGFLLFLHKVVCHAWKSKGPAAALLMAQVSTELRPQCGWHQLDTSSLQDPGKQGL